MNEKVSTFKRWGGLIASKNRRKKLLSFEFWMGCLFTGTMERTAKVFDCIDDTWTGTKNKTKRAKEWATRDGSAWQQTVALLLDLNAIFSILPTMIKTIIFICIEILVKQRVPEKHERNKWPTILIIWVCGGKFLAYLWKKFINRCGCKNEKGAQMLSLPAGSKKLWVWKTVFAFWEICFRDRRAEWGDKRLFFRFEK